MAKSTSTTEAAACEQVEHRPRGQQHVSGVVTEAVVPVVEEQLDVATRRLETDSGVRIQMSVDERVQLVDEPLNKDEISVERVAIDRYVDEPMKIRYEGDTMIVPVLEEVLVVEKRLLLKEEVRITRRSREHRNPQGVTLRREHARVERFGDMPATEQAIDARADNAVHEDATFERRRDAQRQRRDELGYREDAHADRVASTRTPDER